MVMNLEINTAVPHGELAKSLADKLRFYIADTPVPVGGRLPSNREIARCANVSQVTARMAVMSLIREGIVETRGGCGTYVVKHPAELPLGRTGKPRRIGIVLSPWDSEAELVWNIRDLLSEVIGSISAGECKLVILTYAQWQEYAATDPARVILENGLDTLVWFYAGSCEIAFIARMEQQGVRQLLFHRRPPGLHSPAILYDDAGSIGDILSQLSEEERHRTLIISGDPAMPPYSYRLDAWKQQCGKPDADRLLTLPEAPFPQWTGLVLRHELERLKPKAVVDFAGYINPLSKLGEEFFRKLGRPKIFSFTPPAAWQGEHQLHYTCYEPEPRAMSKALRSFFQFGEMAATVYLPLYRRQY